MGSKNKPSASLLAESPIQKKFQYLMLTLQWVLSVQAQRHLRPWCQAAQESQAWKRAGRTPCICVWRLAPWRYHHFPHTAMALSDRLAQILSPDARYPDVPPAALRACTCFLS